MFSRSSVVLFVERTLGGLPPYVCTTDSSVRLTWTRMSARKDRSVRPLDLVYVHLKSPNYPSNVLSDPKHKLIPLTKLLKESVRKCLLTSYARLNPSTSQNPAIMKYDTSLYTVLEDLYEYGTKSYLTKRVAGL